MTLFPDDVPVRSKLGNIGGVAQYAQTAHIPGGGPEGETCARCAHFLDASRKGKGRCWLAANMRGLGYRFTELFRLGHPEWWHGFPTIRSATQAYKYWTPRS